MNDTSCGSRRPEALAIEKRKRRGPANARWRARLLRADGGRLVWVTDAGTRRERPRRRRVDVAGSAEVAASNGGWWVATRVAADPGYWKIDVATPPRLRGGVLTYVDLDVDVIVGPGRRLVVRDLGQMAWRAVAWRYPPRIVLGATVGLVDVLVRIALRRWPFDGSLAASDEAASPRP